MDLPDGLAEFIAKLIPTDLSKDVARPLNLSEFERLVNWIRASLLTAHVAKAEVFADFANDAQLISEARFAGFWSSETSTALRHSAFHRSALLSSLTQDLGNTHSPWMKPFTGNRG